MVVFSLIFNVLNQLDFFFFGECVCVNNFTNLINFGFLSIQQWSFISWTVYNTNSLVWWGRGGIFCANVCVCVCVCVYVSYVCYVGGSFWIFLNDNQKLNIHIPYY